MEKQPCVYILSNNRNSVLYVGVTSNLQKRVWEHKQKIVKGFTQKYNVDKLVYFEIHEKMEQAIEREKNIKKWNRSWKIELIEKDNKQWNDLYEQIL